MRIRIMRKDLMGQGFSCPKLFKEIQMKKVKLNIDGKAYEKAEPTVKDWLDYYDAQMMYQRRTMSRKKKNEAAFEMVTEIICNYLSVEKESVLAAGLKAKEIEQVFEDIKKSIAASFNISDEKQIQIVMNRRMIESAKALAADMFFKQGVLPESFFNQSLEALNRTLSFVSGKMRERVKPTVIDDTNF